MQDILNNIRIVLVETSHSGNIGATARAMKTMGITKLVLVQPKASIDQQAISMASGADDVLAEVEVVPSLLEAIAPCSLVLGASARKRSLDNVCKPVRESVADIVAHNGGGVALVFGSESSGLTNEQLNMCQIHINIPSSPNFSSLNLSQAVQVVCSEVYTGISLLDAKQDATKVSDLASVAEVDGVQQHFLQLMHEIEFMNAAQPKKLQQRLRRILYKAHLEQSEVNILRGFLTAVQKKLTN